MDAEDCRSAKGSRPRIKQAGISSVFSQSKLLCIEQFSFEDCTKRIRSGHAHMLHSLGQKLLVSSARSATIFQEIFRAMIPRSMLKLLNGLRPTHTTNPCICTSRTFTQSIAPAGVGQDQSVFLNKDAKPLRKQAQKQHWNQVGPRPPGLSWVKRTAVCCRVEYQKVKFGVYTVAFCEFT